MNPNEQKLRDLALDHIAAKEEYDKAIHKYQNSYVHVENPERYADVQVALVEVEARLRILKAHVEEMVIARVSELCSNNRSTNNTSFNWISVKDQAPPQRSHIIAWSPLTHAYPYVCYVNDEYTTRVPFDTNGVFNHNVTHWMPAPSSPGSTGETNA